MHIRVLVASVADDTTTTGAEMEYITSRGFELPTDQTEMESLDWFNMWSNRNFPYYELLVGDTLYWFDTIVQKIVWKTEVVTVDRFPYSHKQQISTVSQTAWD